MSTSILAWLNTLSSIIPPPNDSATKKKVLLVHAHPVSDSFSSALADATERGLKMGGHDVRRVNLYSYTPCGCAFSPALTEAERRDYHKAGMPAIRETEEGMNTLKIDTQVKKAVSDLRWCEALVLVYPTWWFGLPAILKGYIDRSFLPGVAFRLPAEEGKGSSGGKTGLLPGLQNIKKVGVVTTYGATQPIVCLAGDNGRALISRGLRPLFAPQCTLVWHGLYAIESKTLNEKEAFLKSVEESFKNEF